MFRIVTAGLLASVFLFSILPSPLLAAEPPEFSPAERSELEKIIREYILANPEIIPEAVAELQRRERLAEEIAVRKAVADNQQRIFNDGISVVIGNPKASVTLVEFYDYQCPFCRRMYEDVLRLSEEDPDLRIVFKQFPINDVPGEYPTSLLAAHLAMAADRQGKFEAFHRNVFVASENEKLDQQRLFQIAESSGLDLKRLQEDMADPAVMKSIQDNILLAREIHVTGTPTYLVGDTIIVGARGYQVLKDAIAQTRKAQKARAAGQ